MTTAATDTSLAKLIKAKCPGAVTGAGGFRGETTLTTTPENLHRLLSTLKTGPDLGFNYLADIAAPIIPGRSQRFEVNYQVSSGPANRSVSVKVSVGEDEPPHGNGRGRRPAGTSGRSSTSSASVLRPP